MHVLCHLYIDSVWSDVCQAPESMKSVVQAAWLLTTAFGDVIVVIVAGVKFFDQVTVLLCHVFAAFLNICCSSFVILSIMLIIPLRTCHNKCHLLVF